MEIIIPLLIFIFNYIKCEDQDFWKDANRKLIFVYEHARHGARGPSSSYNSIFENGVDEYNVTWNYDGELSPIGKRQHYYLGVRNRIKYKNLINFDKYDPREILIHATDYNRTHQSINSELMGMYGDTKEETLSKEEMNYTLINFKYLDESIQKEVNKSIEEIGNQVNKNSIPIFNIHKFDNKRIFLVDDCLKIDQYRNEKVVNKVEELYAEFKEKNYSEKLLKFPLIKKEYFRNYNKMKSISDHYICDYDNKKDLSGFDRCGIDKEEFYNFSRRFYGTFIFHWFVDEYTSGLEETHLMQDLLGYMDRRIKHHKELEPNYKSPKMVMDCGHDTTVGPIARFIDSAFGCGYHDFCDFACNVYFELFYEEKDGKERYTVDYYMDDDLLIKREEYSSFKAKMEKKFWNDTFADKFCGTEEDTYIKKKDGIEKYSTLLLGATFISTSLFLIFATSTFVFFRRYRKLNQKLKENPLVSQEMTGNELPDLN